MKGMWYGFWILKRVKATGICGRLWFTYCWQQFGIPIAARFSILSIWKKARDRGIFIYRQQIYLRCAIVWQPWLISTSDSWQNTGKEIARIPTPSPESSLPTPVSIVASVGFANPAISANDDRNSVSVGRLDRSFWQFCGL
jgi:hypothetical protein